MEKTKKIILCIFAIAVVVAIGVCIYFLTKPASDDSEKPGGEVTTVSNGQIYEDTKDTLHSVTIGYSDYEETQSGDDLILSNANAIFTFECHGLEANKKLYIFADGDIDDVVGEFDIVSGDIFDSRIQLKEKFLNKGKHVLQFVQFDGDTPSFCITRHYEVKE